MLVPITQQWFDNSRHFKRITTISHYDLSPYKDTNYWLYPILYISWLWLIYFATGSLYLLISLTYFSPLHILNPSGNPKLNFSFSNMEIYIIMCKIDSQWEFAAQLTELKLGLHNNLEAWEGRWEGGSRGRGYIYICMPMTDSCWCLEETKTIL